MVQVSLLYFVVSRVEVTIQLSSKECSWLLVQWFSLFCSNVDCRQSRKLLFEYLLGCINNNDEVFSCHDVILLCDTINSAPYHLHGDLRCYAVLGRRRL